MHKCHKNVCPNPRTCKCRTVRDATFPIIWLIGATASGKSSLGKALAEQLGMDYLSGGQILRDEVVRNKHKEIKAIDRAMQERRLIEDTLMLEIMDRQLRGMLKKSQGYILSFIKNLNQAELFETFISPVDLILLLDCPEETSSARAKERLVELGVPEEDLDSTIIEQAKVYNEYISEFLKQYQDKIKKIPSGGTPESVLAAAAPIILATAAKKKAEKPEATCNPEIEDCSAKTPSAAPVSSAVPEASAVASKDVTSTKEIITSAGTLQKSGSLPK